MDKKKISKEAVINNSITDYKESDPAFDTTKISDGCHTFEELYEHRRRLFISLCKLTAGTASNTQVWKSKNHSDGSRWSGWFVMGINKKEGSQITYHLPDKYWNSCDFAESLEKAPTFDGHSSNDVLKRVFQTFQIQEPNTQF